MEIDPETHRMKVYLFGATSSPCCASSALQRTIPDNEDTFPKRITQTANEQFYVNDLLTGIDTVEEEAKFTYLQLENFKFCWI